MNVHQLIRLLSEIDPEEQIGNFMLVEHGYSKAHKQKADELLAQHIAWAKGYEAIKEGKCKIVTETDDMGLDIHSLTYEDGSIVTDGYGDKRTYLVSPKLEVEEGVFYSNTNRTRDILLKELGLTVWLI